MVAWYRGTVHRGPWHGAHSASAARACLNIRESVKWTQRRDRRRRRIHACLLPLDSWLLAPRDYGSNDTAVAESPLLVLLGLSWVKCHSHPCLGRGPSGRGRTPEARARNPTSPPSWSLELYLLNPSLPSSPPLQALETSDLPSAAMRHRSPSAETPPPRPQRCRPFREQVANGKDLIRLQMRDPSQPAGLGHGCSPPIHTSA